MKKVLATVFATMFMLASVPAFACGGDKTAKTDGDSTVMTSVEDGEKVEHGDKAKKVKKSKEAKNEDKTAKTDGEV